jgi:adenine phosphoribosyltransferase
MSPTQLERLIQVYQQALTVRTGPHFTTVNELTDQIPALRPATLRAAALSLAGIAPFTSGKLLCEEDKGAALGAAVSLMADLPLAMARWYPYEVAGGVAVHLSMEYFAGTLYLNGVEPGEEITIVDDTLSTGGTLIALARAVKEAGARVVDIRVVVEKVDNGGRQRVLEELGLEVQAVLGISITSAGAVKVTHALGAPLRVGI